MSKDDMSGWGPRLLGLCENFHLSPAGPIADQELHGVLARDADGSAIGFVHWLFHASTWTPQGYCYLEDLFVAPDARAHGTGAALIAHVVREAREAGAAKVYWLTQEGNSRARSLYDKVATDTGFVHYEIDLG